MNGAAANVAQTNPGCVSAAGGLRTESEVSPRAERYHALDLLRASMMLLGLVLHSACSYMASPPAGSWPFRDPRTHWLFDGLVLCIHLFRMPAFFLMAGFFGALLCDRKGAGAFAVNRIKRVLLPLVFGWMILAPLTTAAFVFAMVGRQAGSEIGLQAAAGYARSGGWLEQLNLIHLWFLYVLLILCVFALGIRLIARHLPACHRAISRSAACALKQPWGPLALGAVTGVTFAPMQFAGIDTVTSLIQPPRILAAYGLFFAMGWLFYPHAGSFRNLSCGWAWRLSLGVLLAVVSTLMELDRFNKGGSAPPFWHLGMAGTALWLILFGLVGLFTRHFDRPLPIARYLSDASYWIYLVHLPILITLAGLVAHVPLPLPLKFLITLAGTAALCVFTYHFAARSTIIGQFLNGRKYPWRSRDRRDTPG